MANMKKPPSIFKQMADHMKRVQRERARKGLPPLEPFRLDVEVEKATEKALDLLAGKKGGK